jgi:hypothetical protein
MSDAVTNEQVPARPKRHRRQKYSAEPIATVPDEEDLGPAMLALNERQRLFVLEWHASPDDYGHAIRACKAAGYAASSEAALRVRAHQLLHSASIQRALNELGPKVLVADGFRSIAGVVAIANDPKVKPETRLKAHAILISHAFPLQTEHKVVVEKTPDMVILATEAVLARIHALASQVGLDPIKQVEAAKMIEDVAEEVTDDAER